MTSRQILQQIENLLRQAQALRLVAFRRAVKALRDRKVATHPRLQEALEQASSLHRTPGADPAEVEALLDEVYSLVERCDESLVAGYEPR